MVREQKLDCNGDNGRSTRCSNWLWAIVSRTRRVLWKACDEVGGSKEQEVEEMTLRLAVFGFDDLEGVLEGERRQENGW